jgi:putative ABC transport system permease protein
MRRSGRRAAARIAWRQARRSRARSALIVGMVALPVAALAATAVVIQTVLPRPEERLAQQMGSTEIAILGWSDGIRPSSLQAKLPPGTRVITRTDLVSSNVVGGAIVYLPLEEFSLPIDRAPVRGMLTLLEGRAPTRPGEVAMRPSSLEAFGAAIGDEIGLEDVGLRLRVTGTVVRPDNISDQVAVVGKGTLRGRPDVSLGGLWVDLPAGASVARAGRVLSADPSVQGYVTAAEVGDDGRAKLVANGASFGAAALALFGTGLIAAAAFTVGTRRQLRLLGVMGAVGAEPYHLRAAVLFGGTALGLVGSVLGVGIGIAGAFAVHPQLPRWAGRIVGPVEFPVLALVGSVMLGTVAATLAAYGPARSAAKLSTVEALAGRTPRPRAPGKLAGLGVGASVVGAGLVAWGTVTRSDGVLTAGLFLMLGGVLVAIPLAVTWVGMVARHLPTVPRLAARDIARNGRRTGAAVAAATIALALPVAISAITLSDEAAERTIPFMANDHLLVSLTAPGDDRQARSHELIRELRSAFAGSLVVPLVPAVFPPDRTASGDQTGPPEESTALVEGPLVLVSEGVSYIPNGVLLVGGPDLLRAFHAAGGIPDLQTGKVVGIGPHTIDHGTVHLQRPPDRNGNELAEDLPAAEAGATRYASLGAGGEYNYVISPRAARRLGLRPGGSQSEALEFVFRSAKPLRKGDIARARTIAARNLGAYVISANDLGSHNGSFRLYASLGGAAVALAIVAVVVALVGAESRRDQAILVAVGAGPRTRRTLAGTSTLLLTTVAGALAVPAGFAPVLVHEATQNVNQPIVVPWAAIVFVVLAVPAVAGVFASFASRQPKAAAMLRPIA